MAASSGEGPFEFRRIGQHLARRAQEDDRWHVVVDVNGSPAWVRCSRSLHRKFDREIANAEKLDDEAARGRMIRAGVQDAATSAAPVAHTLRTRIRVHGLAWWLSPPLAFGGPRSVNTRSAQAAQRLAEKALTNPGGSPERIEDEAMTGWEQNRERLSGVEQRAAYFLGGVGLGATALLASSTFLLEADGLQGGARIFAVVGLLLTIFGLAASAVYALAATMRTFGRITPDITSSVVERARKPDDIARIERAARFIAARRRSSYIANWKVIRLKRAAAASGAAVVGLLAMLMAVLLTIV
ncbi:MAG TPA: hypothetical protein VGW75_16075 [Solirubrobacteraceae bacterium]|nr:hypothetical protein [Solirubrobacteraceae bacterium]